VIAIVPRQQSSSLFQAGFLTPGFISLRSFPTAQYSQWLNTELQSDYSGGPVFDSHEIPFSVLLQTPETAVYAIACKQDCQETKKGTTAICCGSQQPAIHHKGHPLENKQKKNPFGTDQRG